jgi:hypothetical protein
VFGEIIQFTTNPLAQTGHATQLDGFCVVKMSDVAGARFFPAEGNTAWPAAGSNRETEAIRACPEALYQRRKRIIAQGFQVHNTTAEVYRQGACTIGQVGQTNMNDHQRVIELDSTDLIVKHHCNVNTKRCVVPPGTVAEAMEYPNVEKWEAAEGCYCRVGFNGVENPMQRPESRMLAVDVNVPSYTGNIAWTDAIMASAFELIVSNAAAGDNQYEARYGSTVFANTNMTFAIFSGLSADSTLEFTGRTYLEVAPRAGDSLLPVATPGAPYDPKGLQILAAVEAKLPIGVMVKYNDKGTWARMVAHAIGEVVSKIAPVIGTIATPFVGPEAAAIGAGVGAAASGLASLTKKKKNNKKKRPAVNQKMITRR